MKRRDESVIGQTSPQYLNHIVVAKVIHTSKKTKQSLTLLAGRKSSTTMQTVLLAGNVWPERTISTLKKMVMSFLASAWVSVRTFRKKMLLLPWRTLSVILLLTGATFLQPLAQ